MSASAWPGPGAIGRSLTPLVGRRRLMPSVAGGTGSAKPKDDEGREAVGALVRAFLAREPLELGEERAEAGEASRGDGATVAYSSVGMAAKAEEGGPDMSAGRLEVPVDVGRVLVCAW